MTHSKFCQVNLLDLLGRTLFFICYPFIRLPYVLSIYFHNPSPEGFEKTIKWVLKQGYSFIEIQPLLDYMEGKHYDGKKHCIVTFDDAWQGNLKLIPIIEKYHVPITIFAPITPLQEGNYWWEYVQKKGGITLSEEYKTYSEEKFNECVSKLKKNIPLKRTAMTMDELKELSNHPLVNIQCHSYTHPILPNLTEDSLVREMKESKDLLMKELEKDIEVFCYPNGSLTNREIDIAKKYFKCAFSTIQDYPRVGGDLYTIPRYALTNNFGSNLAKMLGVWKWIRH